MIKLLMSKGYKYEATIDLERHVKLGEELPSQSANTSSATAGKGGKDGKRAAPAGKSKDTKKPAAA